MVLLTMTQPMVEAFEKVQSLNNATKCDNHEETSGEMKHSSSITLPGDKTVAEDNTQEEYKEAETNSSSPHNQPAAADALNSERPTAPRLENPKVGNPVSHGQVIELWKQMKVSKMSPCSLDLLMRGARVYIPPPPPKPEPTSEYKALMARLRREEELRAYERMINPPPPMETFAQRFPSSSAAHAFSSNFQHASSPEDDGVTYADVDRQMALIFNVLISIVACAGAIWVVARWWSTPARLALSMGGSMLVGLAEVVVYSGYIRRVAEAKGNAKSLKEVKEVVKTWVIGGEEDEDDTSLSLVGKNDTESESVRRRKPPAL
ncbi:hypothetical protein HYALB_00009920 [Hymenoscyphus albidus]|uniref:Vacuolar h+-atpase assembly protein n=1 Tax=Hymenoscyphus albidus TaxID=595503 RepID=A0A9N9PU15_9HELO|nr:hypothetical protein HYALB_00009920 [Hymenoscyphus albidus]